MVEPLTIRNDTVRSPFEQLAGDIESIDRPRLDGEPELVSLIDHGFVCEWNIPRLRWVLDRRSRRNCSSGQDVRADRGCSLGELLRSRWTGKGVETETGEPW
jgi:hypothetical protein